MPSNLALIALMMFPHLWGHGPAASHPAGARDGHSRVGEWKLGVQTDRFTGRLSCRLASHRAAYRPGAVVFRLGGDVDTSRAVYRIDHGQAYWASNDQTDLARQGMAIQTDNLLNPSGGLVRVPEQRLSQARQVDIQAYGKHPPARFRIDGFGAALDAAKAAGCGPGDFE